VEREDNCLKLEKNKKINRLASVSRFMKLLTYKFIIYTNSGKKSWKNLDFSTKIIAMNKADYKK